MMDVEMYTPSGERICSFTLDTRTVNQLRATKKEMGIRRWDKFLLLMIEIGINVMDRKKAEQ